MQRSRRSPSFRPMITMPVLALMIVPLHGGDAGEPGFFETARGRFVPLGTIDIGGAAAVHLVLHDVTHQRGGDAAASKFGESGGGEKLEIVFGERDEPARDEFAFAAP